jgi:uncharacterized protein YhdP
MNTHDSERLAPKRRWLKILGVIALSALMLIGVGVWAANYYLSRNSQEVLRRLSEQTGLDIKVGNFIVDWRLHRPQIRLEEVQIRSGSTDMTAELLRMEIRIRESLLRRDLRLREVEVKGLNLTLPVAVDQPFGESSKKSVSVSDTIGAWQRFSQIIDVLLLSDAMIGLQPTSGEPVQLKLATLRFSGDQFSGGIAAVASINQSGSVELDGDWAVNSNQEFSLASKLIGAEFPVPLFHKKSADFDMIREKLADTECHDFGTVPCIRMRQFSSGLKLVASERRLGIKLNDLKAQTADMSATGKIAIIAENAAIGFDISIDQAQGTLQSILAVLDSEWMGAETYKWLLTAIPDTTASAGHVRIAGSTIQDGFKDFDINFKAKSSKLVFADDWPAVHDLEAGIKIGADHIEVNLTSGRYGDLPVQTAIFSISSFASQPLMAKVKATTTADLAGIFANLDASPIGKEIAEVRSQLDPRSHAKLGVDVELDLNLSQFEEAGVSYQIRLNSSAARLSLHKGMFEINDADLALLISGQASEKRQRFGLNGNLTGRSSGRWEISEKIHLKFDLDSSRKWLGLRAAIAPDSRISLPKSTGLIFKLPKISGEVRLTQKSGHPHIAAKLGRLIIPDLSPDKSKQPDSNAPQSDGTESTSNLDPVSVPSIDVDIGQLEYSNLELGRVKLAARHGREGLFEITGGIKAPRVSVELDDGEWLRGEAGPTSFFRGRLVMNDTGAVLSKLGLFSGLTSGSSTHDFDLKWLGAPWDFSASDSKGFILSKMTGGELISVDSFFVKLIDILTLKSFKFYEKGSKIERVDAKLRLDSGKLIMDMIDLDLSSTNLKFKGEADLIKETLATDVGMEVKIGEAVGTAAAVVTMGPIGIALGYLSSKTELKLPSLDVLNQLTAFSYRLEGPWEDPELKSFRPKPFGI